MYTWGCCDLPVPPGQHVGAVSSRSLLSVIITLPCPASDCCPLPCWHCVSGYQGLELPPGKLSLDCWEVAKPKQNVLFLFFFLQKCMNVCYPEGAGKRWLETRCVLYSLRRQHPGQLLGHIMHASSWHCCECPGMDRHKCNARAVCEC